MSFVFLFLLAALFKPSVAARYRFDNFESVAYSAGFLLAGVPHALRLAVGDVEYLLSYAHFFSPIHPLALFAASTALYRIYCGNWRESLFLALPSVGIALNFAAESLVPNPVFPAGAFGLELPQIPLIHGFWVPALITVGFLPFARRRGAKFFRGGFALALLAFFGFHLVWNLAALIKARDRHPELALVSVKPHSILGSGLLIFGRLDGIYYFAEADAFSETEIVPHEGLNEYGAELNFLSFNPTVPNFYHRLFYNPNIAVEHFPTKTSVSFEEGRESFLIAHQVKLNVNQFNILESVNCRRLLFNRFELPC